MPSYLVMPLVQIALFLILIPIALKGRIRTGSRSLFISLILCFSVWSLFAFLMRNGPDAASAHLWANWMGAVRLILIAVLFHFSVRYSSSTLHKWVLPGVYFVFPVFAVLSAFGLVVSGARETEFGYIPEPGILFLTVSILALILVAVSFVYLYRSVRQAVYSRERNRDIYFLTGIICLSLGNSINFLTFIEFYMYPGAFIGTIIFFILSCVALIKFRPVEVQTIYRKSLAHIIIALIVGAIYVLIMFFTYSIYDGVLPIWTHALMLLVLVITLRLVWNRVERLVDRWTYGKRYRYLNELRDFITASHDVSNYKKISDTLVELLDGAFRVRFVTLMMLSDTGDYTTISFAGEEKEPFHIANDSVLVDWLMSSKKILYSHDVDLISQLQALSTAEREELQEKEIELIVPLAASMNDLTGMILVGPKISGRIFTDEELDLLTTVSERVSVELENARLYHIQTLIRNELQTQDEMRTDFLHSIAHELKTPLTSLLSSSELLEEDIDLVTKSQRDRIINNIQRSAASMDRRVTELLDFARSRTGGLVMDFLPSDIDKMLTAVVDRMTPIFNDRKQSLNVDIENPLPKINADIDKIEQVMINVLSNASKYSPGECEVVFRVKCTDGYIRTDVEDFAQLIKEEEKERIFEPYYRGNSQNGNKRSPGLGLGLAISKQIVELHDGRIWVENCPGKGNVFSFTIPVYTET